MFLSWIFVEIVYPERQLSSLGLQQNSLLLLFFKEF